MDDALDALAHVQRRKLLVALLDHDPQDDPPGIVAADESGEAMERRIKIEHVHLPKLVEYGFIEWDQDHNKVAKGPNFDEIRPLLELLDDHADELPDGWL